MVGFWFSDQSNSKKIPKKRFCRTPIIKIQSKNDRSSLCIGKGLGPAGCGVRVGPHVVDRHAEQVVAGILPAEETICILLPKIHRVFQLMFYLKSLFSICGERTLNLDYENKVARCLTTLNFVKVIDYFIQFFFLI